MVDLKMVHHSFRSEKIWKVHQLAIWNCRPSCIAWFGHHPPWPRRDLGPQRPVTMGWFGGTPWYPDGKPPCDGKAHGKNDQNGKDRKEMRIDKNDISHEMERRILRAQYAQLWVAERRPPESSEEMLRSSRWWCKNETGSWASGTTRENAVRSTADRIGTSKWRLPKIGVPLNHPF